MENYMNNISASDSDDFAGPLDDVMGDNSLDSFFAGPDYKPDDMTLEKLNSILNARQWEPEKPVGIFEKDVSILRFRDEKRGQELLTDIKAANKKDNMGNVTIPGTEIELINYSYCPQCQTIYSFGDLREYYTNPKQNPQVSRTIQLRKDTRVVCECGAQFFPSLVIVDGNNPKNENQFLCRMQTINSIESYYRNRFNRKVLTLRKSNRQIKDKKVSILNDVSINEMTERPMLITNLLQYTPIPLMTNLINEENKTKGDVIFGAGKTVS